MILKKCKEGPTSRSKIDSSRLRPPTVFSTKGFSQSQSYLALPSPSQSDLTEERDRCMEWDERKREVQGEMLNEGGNSDTTDE